MLVSFGLVAFNGSVTDRRGGFQMAERLLKVPAAITALFMALVAEGKDVGDGFAETLAEAYTSAKRGITAEVAGTEYARRFAEAERALADTLGLDRSKGSGPWADAVAKLRLSAGWDITTPDGERFRDRVRYQHRLIDAEAATQDGEDGDGEPSNNGQRSTVQKAESAAKTLVRYLDTLREENVPATAIVAAIGGELEGSLIQRLVVLVTEAREAREESAA